MMFLKNIMATFIITTTFKEMHSSQKFLTTKNNEQQEKKISQEATMKSDYKVPFVCKIAMSSTDKYCLKNHP